jgi:hypothetical protein
MTARDENIKIQTLLSEQEKLRREAEAKQKAADEEKAKRLEVFKVQKAEADALVAELTHVPGRWFECPAFISPYPMPGRGPGGVEYSYGLSIARFDFYQGGEPNAQLYVRGKTRPKGLPGDEVEDDEPEADEGPDQTRAWMRTYGNGYQDESF